MDWYKKKEDILYQELGNRIEALDYEFSIKDTIEKRTGFSINEGNILTKVYETFLIDHFVGKRWYWNHLGVNGGDSWTKKE